MTKRTYIMSGVAALLAVAVAADRFGPGEPDATAGPVAAVRAVPHTNPLARERIAAYDEILRRPLFSPGRRAEADIVPAAGASSGPLSGYELSGTVQAQHEAFALLRQRTGESVTWLATGKTIDGWVLKSVDDVQAVFEKDGATVALKAHSGNRPAASINGQTLSVMMAEHPFIPTDAMLGLSGP